MEAKKKEISIGIKTYLPEGTVVTASPKPGKYWRVKLIENGVYRQPFDSTQTLATDAEIKFMEMIEVKNEEQH
jgi:hypothetical protein